MKKLFFTSVAFVFFLQTVAFSQTDSTAIKNAVAKLRALLTDHIAEKAYLQLDRPYACYLAGETVYFKAYVTKGERHDLTNISAMLHVDLINKDSKIMQSVLLQLNSGVGWGDFALPDTLQKGSYRIRAYTEWMRNEKNLNFFEEYISVSSPNNADRAAEAVKQNNRPVLQFFPEGGSLVADIRSKIAFKAVGADGLGISFKGVVVNNDNKEVAKIEPSHLGLGVFSLLPEEGVKYKAKVTFADGSQSTVELPAVEPKGITLSVNTDDPAKLSIEIKANRAYYKENLNKQLNLLIYWAGAIRTINTKLDNSILGLDLPTNNFRTGLLQVTLLAQTGEPLNERMVFIQNPDLLNLSLSANKPAFTKRSDVNIDLNARNKDGSPVSGYFSVSVVDESKILVDENTEHSILSYLLLTSDLKGYVEQPNYYFANVTNESRANLDALMLTQGYRRFVWKELLNDNPNTAMAYKPEQYLDITGTLTTKAGVPITNASIILLPLGNSVKTNQQGKFLFAKVAFQNGTDFILKTNSSSGKNAAVIKLDNPGPGPTVGPDGFPESKYNATADILASLQGSQSQGYTTANNGSSRVLLNNNSITGPKRTDNYRSSNLSGPGHADQVIKGDEIKNSPTLSTGLNGRARGIDFVNGVPYLKNNQVVSAGSSVTEAMLIVVDGVVSNPGTSIDILNPSNVETVEVLKGNNGAIYGLNSNGGVMVITTRQGGSEAVAESKEMSPGVFSIKPMGYYKAREFYAPSYNAGQPSGNVPDNRTTVFWKPDVTTSTNGTASFKYFNADGTGNYRVVVEGIDINGNIGRQVLRYKVE